MEKKLYAFTVNMISSQVAVGRSNLEIGMKTVKKRANTIE